MSDINMTRLEKLRNQITELPCRTHGFGHGLAAALYFIDYAIAEERAAKDERFRTEFGETGPDLDDDDFDTLGKPEPANPEPGDVVAYVFADGTVTLDRYDDKPQYNGRLVVLMRAADVRAAIGEGK